MAGFPVNVMEKAMTTRHQKTGKRYSPTGRWMQLVGPCFPDASMPTFTAATSCLAGRNALHPGSLSLDAAQPSL
jgi:hypothetical protein